MARTDMEVLRAAFHIERKGTGKGWSYYAVRASQPQIKRLYEEGMVDILWQHRSEKAYALTEKAYGIIAVTESTREERMVPVSDVMEALEIIKGYDNLKKVLADVVHDQTRCHFLFSGPPACAKSLFLSGVQACIGSDRCYLAFGSRTTAAGLSDMLFEHQPDVLCMDEVDKMKTETLSLLLGLMETGEVIETKSGSRRGIKLNTLVLAACNDESKLPPEIKSRFGFQAHFDHYTRDEFIDVVEHFLHLTGGCPPALGREIGEQVFDRRLGDVRKARDIWNLMKTASREEMMEKVLVMDEFSGKGQKVMPAGARLI